MRVRSALCDNADQVSVLDEQNISPTPRGSRRSTETHAELLWVPPPEHDVILKFSAREPFQIVGERVARPSLIKQMRVVPVFDQYCLRFDVGAFQDIQIVSLSIDLEETERLGAAKNRIET